jgi:hypothetical protein
MIVPNHWAEARSQHRSNGKQITVRRYGWSMVSETDAQSVAQARADEALQRIVAGEKLNRHEPKVAYNGASGVPIREEVLARHGDQVITRNAYGAHCLNSPNALFADIDFSPEGGLKSGFIAFAVLVAASLGTGVRMQSWGITLGLLFLSMIAAAPLAGLALRAVVAAKGGAQRIARDRIADFVSAQPSWNVRIYRTPAGFRVLATHQPFDATSEEVQRFFLAVRADPVYVRMCTNQNCFRARLTAKPWRICVSAHMRPRPGIWPVRPAMIAIRNQWIANYEARAAAYAACRYMESMGSGVVHESIKLAVDLHDRESRALLSGAPLA